MICLKSERELETMDRANSLVHEVLRAVEDAAGPGVSTGELDKLAEEMIRAAGGVPAFKGYRGFPASLCTSINDVIVHERSGMDHFHDRREAVSVTPPVPKQSRSKQEERGANALATG